MMSDEEIIKELESMEKEKDDLRDEFVRLTWWMRGGITHEQLVNLPHKERKFISNLIKENIETSKKTGTPLY
jgi:hypothetical protein